jgi:hypothetical protein
MNEVRTKEMLRVVECLEDAGVWMKKTVESLSSYWSGSNYRHHHDGQTRDLQAVRYGGLG